jgi:MoxR-like ATPase
MGVREVLRAAFLTPGARDMWGLPVLAWGPPGVGKSDVIEGLGTELGVHVEVLSPGERGEGAFGVVPVPVERDGAVVLSYPAPEWTGALTGGAGLVFVDELTTAPPAIQPPLLGLVHARRIGGAILPPRVRVFAAANPPEQAAAGYDLPAPLANRFVHLTWTVPNASDWASWMVGLGTTSAAASPLDLVAEEARVMAAWPAAWARAVGLVTSFVRRQPTLLCKMPNADNAAASRAWPSPRTWELATRSVAAAEIHRLSEIDGDTLLAGCVGEGAARELATWRVEADLPDPAELLDGTVTFSHDKRRLDRTFAVFGSCAALVVGTKEKQTARSERLWALFHTVMEAGAPDLCVPAGRTLVNAQLFQGKEARRALIKLSPILSAARAQ